MKNPTELLNYDMGPRVKAFSTTRKGGYSQGSYGEFNINRYCGDDASAIQKNREALCRLLGVEEHRLVMPHQTHQTHIAVVDEWLLGQSDCERQKVLEGIDALMTNTIGACIGVSTADCIPVLIYDERQHAACAVHAGWRGTVARIVEKAVAAMQRQYGSRPEELRAQIGPGISLDSFEVGQEVYDAFLAADFDMQKISRRYPAMRDSGAEKWHIDLPACNHLQLLQAGLTAERIADCGVCTYRQHERFFSARRLGVQSGRIFTGILLTE